MNGRKFPVNSSMAIGLPIDIKKCVIGALLLGAGFSLFAQTTPPKTSIFIPPITGIGKNQNDNEVIATMLASEIKSRNIDVGKSLRKADFILYGTLAPYHEEEQYYHNYVFLNEKDTSTDVIVYTYNLLLRYSREQVYIFQLILKNQKTNEAMLVQNLLYSSIDDVYNFFPLLIYNMFSQINAKKAPVKKTPAKKAAPEIKAAPNVEDWRNKWLYLRESFDFPITFYKLKGDGLIAGSGVYDGEFDSPDKISQLDNKVVTLPAITLGAEVQLLNWLSIEPNFQIGWEYLYDRDFITVAAGLELKFPLKFIENIMLEPYVAVAFPVYTSSEVFNSFPTRAFGVGCQFGTKGWKNSDSIFIDINYMYNIGDAVTSNPYKDLYPEPEEIHYQRSAIRLGIGYKFGVIDRK